MGRFVAILAVLLGVSPGAAAETWSEYRNGNYGIIVSFPSSEVGVVHKTGKGRSWLAQDRTVIQVEGEVWTEESKTWVAYRKLHLQGMAEDGIKVSRQDSGEDWFSVWGAKGDGQMYLYIKRSGACPRIALGVAFIFLEKIKARHWAWIRRMTASLKGGSAKFCP